ncbi:MAG: ATP-binding protein [Gemmatimonadaceae bacterium]
MRWSSIRTRLTFWYTAILGTLVVAFALGSFMLIRTVLAKRADRFLHDAIVTFRDEVKKETDQGSSARDVIHDELLDFRFREINFLVFDEKQLLETSPLSPLPPRDGDVEVSLDTARLKRSLHEHDSGAAFTLDDSEGGFRVEKLTLQTTPTELTVVAVQSWHGYSETLEAVAVGYTAIVPLLLVFAAVGGYALASRGLSPITEMSRKAASIHSRNLDARLVASNPDDEVGELATVFNRMLSRIEGAFLQQQQFMQDASHELRSPVAAVRAEAEVALAMVHRGEKEYRDALKTIRHSAVRLSRIVDDLFLLARHDSEALVPVSATVDLGEIVSATIRTLRAVAAHRQVRLQIEEIPEALVQGDAAYLERAVLNLLDNAVKYTRRGTTVTISVEAANESCIIRVRDEGDGIPVNEQQRVFDRFFRAMDHHQNPGEAAPAGAGLGLPIARMICEAHGGRLVLLSSTDQGSEFVISLPRARV